jgi:uncharacterized paraquat-inducible protein A
MKGIILCKQCDKSTLSKDDKDICTRCKALVLESEGNEVLKYSLYEYFKSVLKLKIMRFKTL